MRTAGVLAVMLCVAAPLPPLRLCPEAAAQESSPTPIDSRSWLAEVSHYGKWVALAGAVGLTTVAIFRNQDADQVYDGLSRLCQTGGDTCVLKPDRTYLNPDAEALYQETRRLDSQARHWMIAGQGTLVLAGAMFVVDLVAGTRRPENIPYSSVEYFADGRRLGLRVRF
jgi:hypothetical protein